MIALGYYALAAALGFAVWATLAAAVAHRTGRADVQCSAERGVVASFALILVAVVALLHAFLTDRFEVNYVYSYSSAAQPVRYKLAALWGGQAGSLLFWVAILGGMAALMIRANRRRNRALMPIATAVVAGTMSFFLLLCAFVENPFELGPPRPDGVGLNPQLKNYWMLIHPPTLYLGYVGFTIPFAFAIAALVTRRTDDVWFRTTRRWTLAAWFFLGAGILLGAYWAYIELGWGGYWAWDPVENASLMPWLTGTAFLHSVMIQEKKGMLKVWNVLLVILTFALSIFGTFLTRSGIISSVHSFATSGIGPAFAVFLGIVFFGSLALLVLRLEDLRSAARLESLLSRESTFLFNNMVLVGIAACVLLLTTFPILSEWVTSRKVTMGPPIFNLVNVPWALVLLFLAGVGPLIAWRKATASHLKRQFTVPLLVGGWVTLAALVLDVRRCTAALGGLFRSFVRLDVVGALEHVQTFYAPLAFGIGAFVLATVAVEFHRGVRLRRHRHGETAARALAMLLWTQKRRYGGYIVHAGIVVIFFGIAGSSAYRVEHVAELSPGEAAQVAGYTLRYEGARLEVEDDHASTVVELSLFDEGRFLGYLEAEQRQHPHFVYPQLREAFERALERRGADPASYTQAVREVYARIAALAREVGREVHTPSTEVAIRASFSPLRPTRFAEDVYVIPLWTDPDTQRASFRIFVHPLVNLIWLGGILAALGAVVCVLPDLRERARLGVAREAERRAVA